MLAQVTPLAGTLDCRSNLARRLNPLREEHAAVQDRVVAAKGTGRFVVPVIPASITGRRE